MVKIRITKNRKGMRYGRFLSGFIMFTLLVTLACLPTFISAADGVIGVPGAPEANTSSVTTAENTKPAPSEVNALDVSTASGFTSGGGVMEGLAKEAANPTITALDVTNPQALDQSPQDPPTPTALDLLSAPAADREKLIALDAKITNLFGAGSADIHAANYKAAAVAALQAAHTDAKVVIDNPAATQGEVNAAYAALIQALNTLTHNHPILSHSHAAKYGGINGLTGKTGAGQTVIVEIKGDIRDVNGFHLDGKRYSLKAVAGEDAYTIRNKDGKSIGSIVSGSAVIVLPASFTKTLKNGTHTISLKFKDNYGEQSRSVGLTVKRTSSGASSDEKQSTKPDKTQSASGASKDKSNDQATGSGSSNNVINGTNNNNGGDGDAANKDTTNTQTTAGAPKTGDETSPALLLGIAGIALLMLSAALHRLKRRTH
jgi:LPXTG-motif cell wall-anchored protein